MRLKPGADIKEHGRVSVYTFNEKVLALHGVAWATWVLQWPEPVPGLSLRDALALFVLVPCAFLLVMQFHVVHRRIDGDGLWAWPPSLLIRIVIHFHCAVFWFLIMAAVMATIDEMADVRLIEYATIALLHAGKVLRLALFKR